TSTSALDTTTTTLGSTTTTLDSTTSTTTAAPNTTSTSTTAAPSSSTSVAPTTSLPTSSTTTTLPACTGTDCPDEGCGTQVAFAPLRCRLDALTGTVHDTSALAPMRDHLTRQLVKTRLLFDRAEVRCSAARRAPAARKLRGVRRRLMRLGKQLQSKLVRRTVPASVTAPIAARASALGADVR